VTDADCIPVGSFLSCSAGTCERASHPIQTDDSQCATCHPADSGAAPTAPIAVVHAILQRTQDPQLQIGSTALGGGTGPGGAFNIGDTPSLSFAVSDANGPVADLLTNSRYSVSLVVAGPTSAPRQLYASALNVKTGAVSFDGTLYHYTFPSPLPQNAVAPLNNPGGPTPANPPGAYAAWLYVVKTQATASIRNTANAILTFPIGSGVAPSPRQVIRASACNACHVTLQAHGGSRQDAEGCFACHNRDALDRTVGAKGIACTVDANCPGNAAGWETCQDTKPPAGNDTCVVSVDPTPNQSIDFRRLVHGIHFGRRLGGYAEQSFLPPDAGKFEVLGFNNSVNDFSDVLLPIDVRSCKTCHADTAASCSNAAPCGYGQSCQAGKCVNTSWLEPSTAVCTSCHDEDDAVGHTQLNTWTSPGGPVETCGVCHGPGAQFAVDVVHNITSPYVPPYTRE
jgi:OmcA/MtrC family decaheme c-type cytochrome